MPNVALKFTLTYIEKDGRVIGIKVQFQNLFFAKTVKLATLDKYPKNQISEYECQCQPKYIEFVSYQPEIERAKVEEFASELKALLEQICIKRIKNKRLKEIRSFNTLYKLLDFTVCCGVRVVQKDVQQFKAGDMVLFYFKQNKQGVKKLIQCIGGFTTDIINYPLKSLKTKYSIPQRLVRNVFNQMLKVYGSELQSLAVFHQFSITNMGICKRNNEEDKKQWFLSLHVEGVLTNAHVFYLALQYQMSSIPLYLLEINSIRAVKMNKIAQYLPYQQNIRMVDANHILIMNRKYSKADIQNLTIGTYMLGQIYFREQQLDVLRLQYTGSRFKKYLKSKQLQYKELNVQEDYILLKCNENVKQKIITQCKAFLKKFKLEKDKCDEFFPNPFLANIFHRVYRQQIQKQVYIKFYFEKDVLWRQYYTIDRQKIQYELQSIKQKMVSEFVSIPSVVPISQYFSKLQNFEGLYLIQKNPNGFWEKSLKSIKYKLSSQTELILSELQNLVDYQEQIIFIMHNGLPKKSIMYKIVQQNGINVEEFINGTQGQKACRIKKFPTKDSISFRSITLLYFDTKRYQLRHVEQDLQNCFKSYQNQQRLNIMMGKESRKMIEQLFPKILIRAHQLTEQHVINVRKIYVYYEDQILLSTLQRIIINSRLEIPIITRNFIDKWSVLRMHNMQQFIFSYYWNKKTCYLPGLESGIYRLHYCKNPFVRFILTFPTKQDLQNKYHQFLIDFKQKIVYEVDEFFINQYEYKELAKQFQKFIAFMSKQFHNLEYFVAYAASEGKEIGKYICMNLYYIMYQNQRKFLLPLAIDLHKKSVKFKQKEEALPFALPQKHYNDWFKLITHKDLLPILNKCLEK